jgi:hypothetical protein
MTELEYFRLLAPEFASVPDATVNQWLSVAGNLTETGCLDTERAAMARALYAAHMLSLTTRSGQGGAAALGPVTSEKEGDLQRSYGGLKGGDTILGSTSYGQQYLDVTRACFGSAIMTRGSS